MKKAEHDFCMSHFKLSIVALLVVIVIVVGWTAYHCGNGPRRELEIALAAATTATASTIDVKAPMTHPYWGNCSKCHVTTGAGKPVSKVMAGAPISVNDKATHKYWGNCLLCHKVTDGVQAAPGASAKAAALNTFTAQTLGLKLQTVDAATMRSLGLANEDGVLVVDVQPGSIAALAGFSKGDEIIRVAKQRIETVNNFEDALTGLKAGSSVTMAIYTGTRKRNIYLSLPAGLPETVAVNPAQVGAAPLQGKARYRPRHRPRWARARPPPILISEKLRWAPWGRASITRFRPNSRRARTSLYMTRRKTATTAFPIRTPALRPDWMC